MDNFRQPFGSISGFGDTSNPTAAAPEVNYLSLPEWEAHTLAESNADLKRAEDAEAMEADELSKVALYSNYVREQFLKSKAYTLDTESEIRQGVAGILFDKGLIDQEDTAQAAQTGVFAKKFGSFEDRFKVLRAGVSGQDEEFDLVSQYDASRKVLEQAGGKAATAADSDFVARYELARNEVDALTQSPEVLNKAKRRMLASGEVKFAEVVDSQENGPPQTRIEVAMGAEADPQAEILKAIKAGALSPDRAYEALQLVQKVPGLERPIYQVERSSEVTGKIEALLTDPAYGMAERYDLAMRELAESAANLDKGLPPVIDAEALALGVSMDLEKSGLLAPGQSYDQAEVKLALQKLGAQQALRKDLYTFHTEEGSVGNNIRVHEDGSVFAHPAVLVNRQMFDQAIAERGSTLSPGQVRLLETQRAHTLDAQFDDFNALLQRAPNGMDQKWAQFRNTKMAEGVTNGAILDEFLADKENFDAMAVRLGGVGRSVLDGFGELAAFIPALSGADWASEYLANNDQQKSDRREVARIFGTEFGMGQDIAEAITPMAIDLIATALLAPVTEGASVAGFVAKQGAKVTAKGLVKSVVGRSLMKGAAETSEQAAMRNVLAGTIKASTSVDDAVKIVDDYTKLLTSQYPTLPAVFVTAANRSGAATYGSIYNTLRNDPESKLTAEEMHQTALGGSLTSAAITGLITMGFGAVGRGGVEDLVLAGATRGQVKKALTQLAGVDDISDDAFKLIVKDQLKKSVKEMGLGGGAKLALPGAVKSGIDEALEEGLDQFVNSWVEESFTGDERMPMSERLQQTLHAATIGGVLGGGMTATMGGMRKLRYGSDALEAHALRKAEDQFINSVTGALEASGSPTTAGVMRSILGAGSRGRLRVPEGYGDADNTISRSEAVDVLMAKPAPVDPAAEAAAVQAALDANVDPESVRSVAAQQGDFDFGSLAPRPEGGIRAVAPLELDAKGNPVIPATAPFAEQEAREAIAQWDRANKNSRADVWFEGGNANEDTNRGWAEAAQAGHVAAHGMAKESTLTGALNNLLGLLSPGGIDTNRGRGGLDTASLVATVGSGAGAGTASGSAYTDGPFVLLARDGSTGLITDAAQIGGVLVNQANAAQAAHIAALVRAARPDVVVGTYSQAAQVIRDMRAGPTVEQGMLDLEQGLPWEWTTAAASETEDEINYVRDKARGQLAGAKQMHDAGIAAIKQKHDDELDAFLGSPVFLRKVANDGLDAGSMDEEAFALAKSQSEAKHRKGFAPRRVAPRPFHEVAAKGFDNVDVAVRMETADTRAVIGNDLAAGELPKSWSATARKVAEANATTETQFDAIDGRLEVRSVPDRKKGNLRRVLADGVKTNVSLGKRKAGWVVMVNGRPTTAEGFAEPFPTMAAAEAKIRSAPKTLNEAGGGIAKQVKVYPSPQKIRDEVNRILGRAKPVPEWVGGKPVSLEPPVPGRAASAPAGSVTPTTPAGTPTVAASPVEQSLIVWNESRSIVTVTLIDTHDNRTTRYIGERAPATEEGKPGKLFWVAVEKLKPGGKPEAPNAWDRSPISDSAIPAAMKSGKLRKTLVDRFSASTVAKIENAEPLTDAELGYDAKPEKLEKATTVAWFNDAEEKKAFDEGRANPFAKPMTVKPGKQVTAHIDEARKDRKNAAAALEKARKGGKKAEDLVALQGNLDDAQFRLDQFLAIDTAEKFTRVAEEQRDQQARLRSGTATATSTATAGAAPSAAATGESGQMDTPNPEQDLNPENIAPETDDNAEEQAKAKAPKKKTVPKAKIPHVEAGDLIRVFAPNGQAVADGLFVAYHGARSEDGYHPLYFMTQAGIDVVLPAGYWAQPVLPGEVLMARRNLPDEAERIRLDNVMKEKRAAEKRRRDFKKSEAARKRRLAQLVTKDGKWTDAAWAEFITGPIEQNLSGPLYGDKAEVVSDGEAVTIPKKWIAPFRKPGTPEALRAHRDKLQQWGFTEGLAARDLAAAGATEAATNRNARALRAADLVTQVDTLLAELNKALPPAERVAWDPFTKLDPVLYDRQYLSDPTVFPVTAVGRDMFIRSEELIRFGYPVGLANSGAYGFPVAQGMGAGAYKRMSNMIAAAIARRYPVLPMPDVAGARMIGGGLVLVDDAPFFDNDPKHMELMLERFPDVLIPDDFPKHLINKSFTVVTRGKGPNRRRYVTDVSAPPLKRGLARVSTVQRDRGTKMANAELNFAKPDGLMEFNALFRNKDLDLQILPAAQAAKRATPEEKRAARRARPADEAYDMQLGPADKDGERQVVGERSMLQALGELDDIYKNYFLQTSDGEIDDAGNRMEPRDHFRSGDVPALAKLLTPSHSTSKLYSESTRFDILDAGASLFRIEYETELRLHYLRNALKPMIRFSTNGKPFIYGETKAIDTVLSFFMGADPGRNDPSSQRVAVTLADVFGIPLPDIDPDDPTGSTVVNLRQVALGFIQKEMLPRDPNKLMTYAAMGKRIANRLKDQLETRGAAEVVRRTSSMDEATRDYLARASGQYEGSPMRYDPSLTEDDVLAGGADRRGPKMQRYEDPSIAAEDRLAGGEPMTLAQEEYEAPGAETGIELVELEESLAQQLADSDFGKVLAAPMRSPQDYAETREGLSAGFYRGLGDKLLNVVYFAIDTRPGLRDALNELYMAGVFQGERDVEAVEALSTDELLDELSQWYLSASHNGNPEVLEFHRRLTEETAEDLPGAGLLRGYLQALSDLDYQIVTPDAPDASDRIAIVSKAPMDPRVAELVDAIIDDAEAGKPFVQRQNGMSRDEKRNYVMQSLGHEVRRVLLANSYITEAQQAAAREKNVAEADALGLESGNVDSVFEAFKRIAEDSAYPTPLRIAARILMSSRGLTGDTSFFMGAMDLPISGAHSTMADGTAAVRVNLLGSNGESLASVLVHEYLHTFLTSAINADPASLTPAQSSALASLRQLFAETKAAASQDAVLSQDPRLMDGLANLDEFVAHFFTSSTFQAKVKELGATPSARGAKKVPWFQRIMDAIMDFFGFPQARRQDATFKALLDLSFATQASAGPATMGQVFAEASVRAADAAGVQLARLEAFEKMRRKVTEDRTVTSATSAEVPKAESVVKQNGGVVPDQYRPNNARRTRIDLALRDRIRQIGKIPDEIPVVISRAQNTAAWTDATGTFYVNPDRFAAAIYSIPEEGQKEIIQKVVEEELDHMASIRAVTEKQFKAYMDSLSEEDYLDTAAKYMGSSYQFPADPTVLEKHKRMLAEERIRMRKQEVITGVTTEEVIAFWRSKPSARKVMSHYLKQTIARFERRGKARKGLTVEEAVLIDRMQAEVIRLKKNYRAPVPFGGMLSVDDLEQASAMLAVQAGVKLPEDATLRKTSVPEMEQQPMLNGDLFDEAPVDPALSAALTAEAAEIVEATMEVAELLVGSRDPVLQRAAATHVKFTDSPDAYRAQLIADLKEVGDVFARRQASGTAGAVRAVVAKLESSQAPLALAMRAFTNGPADAEAPVAEAPVAEAPVAEAPVAEAPVAEAPVAEAPVAEAPVAQKKGKGKKGKAEPAPVAEPINPADPDWDVSAMMTALGTDADLDSLGDTELLDANLVLATRFGSDSDLPAHLEAGTRNYDEFINLLRLPVMEVGTYKAPSGFFTRLFRGEFDPRIRRLMDHKASFEKAATTLLTTYKKAIDKIIGQDFTSPEEIAADAAAASGTTEPTFTKEAWEKMEERYLDELAAVTVDDAEVQTVVAQLMAADPQLRQIDAEREAKRSLYALKRQAVTSRRDTRERRLRTYLARQAKRHRDDALNRVNAKSPRLAAKIIELRKLTDELSKKARDIMGTQNPGLEITFDSQMGLYVTRAYRMFDDANYREAVLTPGSPKRTKDIEDTLELADRFFERQYLAYRQAEYLKAGEAKADAERMSREDLDRKHLNGTSFGEQARIEFLMNYEEPGAVPKMVTDPEFLKVLDRNLKQRQSLPPEIRGLLGEYGAEEGANLLLHTFATVSGIVSHVNLIDQIKAQGSMGNVDEQWLLSAQDLETMGGGGPEGLAKGKVLAHQRGFVEIKLPSGHRSIYNPLIGYYGPKELQEAISRAGATESLDAAVDASRGLVKTLTGAAAKATGGVMGIKTMGSVGHFLRNITSQLFMAFGQGRPQLLFRMPGALKGELKDVFIPKALRGLSDQTIEDKRLEYVQLGIVGDEVRAGILRDLLRGERSVDEIQKQAMEMFDALPEGAAKGSKLFDDVTAFLGRVEAATEAFYKIAYYEDTLEVLQKAHKDGRGSIRGVALSAMSPMDLKREAAEQVRSTAPSHGRTLPVVRTLTKSGVGLLLAPFLRWKSEMVRTPVNTVLLAMDEMKSGNPVLVSRGAARFLGITGMVLGSGILPVLISQLLGGVGDDEDEALRDSMPEYLRNHSFIYFDYDNQLRSLDLTYVNPFAQLSDPWVRAVADLMKPGGGVGHAAARLVTAGVTDTFLDDQILFGTLVSARRNLNPTTGDPIWVEGVDSPGEAATKALKFVLEGTVLPRLLADSYKAFAATGKDAALTKTKPGEIFWSGIYPVRVRPVDPEQQMRRFMFQSKQDFDLVTKNKYKALADSPLSEEEVQKLYEYEVEMTERINSDVYRKLVGFSGLGVAPAAMATTMTEMGYGKTRTARVFEGVMSRPELPERFVEAMSERAYGPARLQAMTEAYLKTPPLMLLSDVR